MIQELTQNLVVLGLIGGMLFGASVFFKVRADPDDPESLDVFKLGTTVILGGVVGGVFGALGVRPTYENVFWALTSFAGTIMLLENAMKAFVYGERRQAERGFGLAVESFIRDMLKIGTTREEVTESAEKGASEVSELNEDEQREAWEDEYPDEDTMAQVDDEPLGENEYEGEMERARMGETESNSEQEHERDANESETGGLPPA